MEPDVTNWLELLKGGGNAAIVVLAVIAVKVANRFLDALRDITTTMEKNHAEVIASQESIKRAAVASNPATAKIFDRSSSG